MKFAVGVSVALLFMFSTGSAQTSPVTVFGVATNTFAAPTINAVTTTCSGTTTWTYQVAALDAAGGSTAGSTQVSVTTSCTTSGIGGISNTAYNLIEFTAPVGAVLCNIYRVTPATGRIAAVPCGSNTPQYYLDDSTATLDGSQAPGIPSTGSILASGTVTGQNFLSNGTGAGTSDWVAGSALPLCTQGVPLSQPQPCIQANSFFLQAPPSPITAFGWTAPSGASTVSAPLIVGQSTNSSGVPTSTLSYGFTDTAGTITAGALATYTASGTVGNCTSLPCNPIIGVFTPSTPPTWIASGETTVNLDATVNVTFNDILCASATVQGAAHDNGSIACTTGEWVGIAKTTSTGSVSSTPAFVVLK
jgi:hypothetical protein